MQKSTLRGITIFGLDLCLFFALIHWLPFSDMENKGLAMLVFVGILWLTEAFHITITALTVPIFAIFLNILDTKAAFAPFAEPIIFMFFGGFVIAAILNIQKLDLWIANHIIRLARGNLKRTVIYLLGATAGLSMFINNTAVTAMMLPLTIGILANVDVNKNRSLHVFVLLGVAYSASIGGIATLVGSAPNALLATQIDVTFAEWLRFGIPVAGLLMVAMVAIMWIVLRPDFNCQFEISMENIPLNGQRIYTLVLFIITAILLISSQFIEAPVREFFGLSNKIKSFDAVIVMIAIALMFIGNVARWQEVQDRTEWGVLMLFGGGLVLSIILKNTGASDLLSQGIAKLVGNQPVWVMTCVLTAFVVFLTEFTSNTATAALLMPIFISVANSLGLPPISLAAIIACGASCAFMLPIATPPNAIVFSTGHIKQKEMATVGFYLNLVCIAVIGGLAYFDWVNG